jgi:exodeoxyribonuclease VII large subunit
VGDLYAAFVQLKERLEREGLFDRDRKRALPGFARRIGIVTSPAAACAMCSHLRRRAPHVEVVLYPTPVQGEGAAQRIANAIQTASGRAECDVLLVCRGGGSIEDLWSFNEEVVARAIVEASMPVISGVGHETDFTIADFAADLRAPPHGRRRAGRHRPRGLAGRTARPCGRPHPRPAPQPHRQSPDRGLAGAPPGQPRRHIAHERVKLAALQTRLCTPPACR